MASDSEKYVLALPSWYPSRVHKFNGDFNERFVKAVSAEFKQVVLYVIKDKNVKTTDVEIFQGPNIITYIVYYPTSTIPVIKYVYHTWQHIRLTRSYLHRIIKNHGVPEIIHCYIFYRAMIFGTWLSRKYNLPVVISENWTAFYKTNPRSLYSYNWFMRMFFRYLLRSAKHIMPVAQKLENEIKKWAPSIHQTIIPNAVDTGIFKLEAKAEQKEAFVFLHVSSMKYQKNIDGLLNAFEILIRNGAVAKLHLVGPVPAETLCHVQNSENLKNNIYSYGELKYEEVAKTMKNAHCLVMFSRYENLPCVILEALCCGLPVISTDVGGVADVINSTNGILIPTEDKAACTQAMLDMLNNYSQYNCPDISHKAISTFSYQVVGKQIARLYTRLLTLK